jgi:hypothetical protein
LLDALAHGFCGVETDVFLVDGKLFVGHSRSELKPERTPQELYLDTLRGRVDENGGRVYRDGPPLTLLIDIKSDSYEAANLRQIHVVSNCSRGCCPELLEFRARRLIVPRNPGEVLLHFGPARDSARPGPFQSH